MTFHRNPRTLARRTNGNRSGHVQQASGAPLAPIPQNSQNNSNLVKMAPKKAPKKRQSRVEQEIKDLQSSTHPILPASRFQLIVKEIMQDYMTDIRVSKEAMDALQSSTEAHLVKLFEQTNKVTLRSGRATIKKEDMELVMDLLND